LVREKTGHEIRVKVIATMYISGQEFQKKCYRISKTILRILCL
jgi:hypothetical protein